MAQRDPPGEIPGQRTGEMQGQGPRSGEFQGPPGQVQGPGPVPEMEVTSPTLRWISIPHPQQPAPIGEDDYVLDSFFNVQYNTWEVLVLVEPGDEESDDE